MGKWISKAKNEDLKFKKRFKCNVQIKPFRRMNFAMLKKVYRVVSLESLTSEHFSGDWRVFRQISEFNTLLLLSYSVGKATQILCVKSMCMNWKPSLLPFKFNFSSADYPAALRLFPFFRTDRPDPSRRNENFTINQNYPARSVKS